MNSEAMLAPFACVAPAFQHEPSWLTLRRIPPHDVAMKSAVHAMRSCFQICSPVAAHKKTSSSLWVRILATEND
jgi:hypothetical protein